MSEHDGLVDLCLAEPRPLVPGGEDLHRHVLPPPLAPPHLPEPALADALLQHDGASDGPLHQQRQTCGTREPGFGSEPAVGSEVMVSRHLLPDPDPEVLISPIRSLRHLSADISVWSSRCSSGSCLWAA